MNESSSRFESIFLEVFEALPRQGPGSRACAERALGLCAGLPPEPAILDLGCGAGGQTLQLAELTAGSIVAVDRHAPSIAILDRKIAARGLSHRVRAQVGDMADPGLSQESFDLIWSEGAFYNIGIANALRTSFGLLRPGGFLAFTDAVWRVADPPPEVRACFEPDYPTMGRAEDVEAAIRAGGFVHLRRFTLPDEAWWDDFYTPMLKRIEVLRVAYGGDAGALGILDRIAEEPAMHRRHSNSYAYEFFVAQRPPC